MSDLPAAARERLRVLLITVGALGTLTVLALLAWRITHVLLVIFAAVLLAILLDGLARVLARRLRLGHLPALVLGLLIVAAALAGFGLLAGPQVSEQLGQLGERLPEAVAQIRATIEGQAWGRALLRSAPAPAELVASPGDVLGPISGVFSTALATVLNLSVILIMGLYLAADPTVYLDGLRLLVPQKLQPRAEEVLGALGQALRWWLIGRISSMVAVGEIARTVRASPTTVAGYLRRTQLASLSWPLAQGLSERALEAALFPPQALARVKRPEPDWEAAHRQVGRAGEPPLSPPAGVS